MVGTGLQLQRSVDGRPQRRLEDDELHAAGTGALCGKSHVRGRIVSHAHNVSLRRFSEPQSVRAVVDGATRRIRVCTRCIKSNKVVKAA